MQIPTASTVYCSCMPEMVRAESVVNKKRNADAEATCNKPENQTVPLLHSNIVRAIMRSTSHGQTPPFFVPILHQYLMIVNRCGCYHA